MKETEAEVRVLKNPKPSIKMEGAKATQGAGMMCREAQKQRLWEFVTEKSNWPKVFLSCLFFENLHLCF